MYQIRAKFLENIYAGDIVYLRRDGIVIAAKLQQYEIRTEGSCAFTTMVMHRADGIDERVYLENERPSYAYKTIEDAIHDKRIAITVFSVNDIYEDLGFVERTNSIGRTVYAKIMYKWDGYKATKVCVYADAYILKFVYGDILAEYKSSDGDKFYETREECMKEHQTKVITF